MNRPLKFRAWDEENGRMVEPSVNMFVDTYNGGVYWQRGYEVPEPFGHTALMQYTGLDDSKGVPIYEGDIVKCYQAQGLGFVTGIVHFGIADRDGWPDPRIYLDTRPFQAHNGSKFCIFHKSPEVIGNIFENKDLLA